MVLEQLKTFLFPSSNFLIIDGIRIPKAYTLLADWEKRYPGKTPPPSSIRIFKKNYSLVFDPSDVEYNAFLEQCKKDSNSLRKTLSDELRARGLPLSEGKLSESKKKMFSRVSVIIRPPFFSSGEEKSEETRWHGEGISFILHFDENHRLQAPRFLWSAGYQEENVFKNNVGIEMKKNSEALSQCYGNWSLMAKILVDYMEKHIGIVYPLWKNAA